MVSTEQQAITTFKALPEVEQAGKLKAIPVFVAEGIRLAEIVGNPSLNAYEIGKEIAAMDGFAARVDKAHKTK